MHFGYRKCCPALVLRIPECLFDRGLQQGAVDTGQTCAPSQSLVCGAQPGGTKYALSLLGKCENVQRSPLVPISADTEMMVRNAMVHAGLIN